MTSVFPTSATLRPAWHWGPSLPPPVVVKPVDADNSLGVSKVDSVGEFNDALTVAFAHSTEVLVETYIELGREVRCGIIVRNGELIGLPLEEYELDPVSKPIRGYEDKIGHTLDGAMRLVAKDATRAWMVDIDDPITTRVWEVAKKAHLALGCRDYSLFDFRIDPSGQPWFLEAGLYCSFAPDSVICTMARAAGISLADLFEEAITAAAGR
jgi:D-alanine-D-alanine ligase